MSKLSYIVFTLALVLTPFLAINADRGGGGGRMGGGGGGGGGGGRGMEMRGDRGDRGFDRHDRGDNSYRNDGDYSGGAFFIGGAVDTDDCYYVQDDSGNWVYVCD